MNRSRLKSPAVSLFGLDPRVLIVLILGALAFGVVLTSQAYALRIRWQNGELEMKPAVGTAPVTTATVTKQ